MTCASCNAENRPEARFCAACGAPLERLCPNGHPVAAGARFCDSCGAALEVAAPAREAPAAERRLVSVLFADLVGFTTLSESRDAEEVRELLSRYFDSSRRLIELYGGTVEKFIGDAVMAVWGTPVATEDDAERAVRAALDLVAAVSALGDELGAPDLRARAGVLTGEAAVTLGAVGQGMVAGDLVNTASRVQSAAAPGAVYVGEATRRASERAIAYEDAGEHELKGKEGAVRLWRALRVVSGVGGTLKSEGLEAPFTGRDRELRLIKELYHACAAERKAHLVSITGIAGIGKSRLGWEFYKYFDGIVEEVWWHRGRCLAYGEGIAYWALADMVRMRCRIAEDEPAEEALRKLSATLHEQLLDEGERRFVEPRLAQLLGLGEAETADRQDLFAAWRLFFERLSDSNPVVLLFEDLQWADASLLDFVEYLLEWSRSHPILVVTLARPELAERRPTWGAGLRNFGSLYLEPLPEPAMRELLAGLAPGLPEALQERILARAEGVPLYAVETVRMLLDRGLLARDGAVYRPTGEIEALAVPETLQALIAARLDGLDERERRLLQDGAVLGKTFARNALAALAGGPPDELEPLLAGLVRKEVLSVQADPRSPEHGQYGFLQDLVRRVAYETLARRDRKARHLAAADHLAATLGEDEAAEVVASHLLAAHEAAPDDDLKGRAADALVRAGERAASLAAASEAQRYFERAAELNDDPVASAGLVDRAGRMAHRAGKEDEARRLLERALGAYDERDDRRRAAGVSAVLAELDFLEGHARQATDRLEPALAALEAEEPDADLAEVAAQLGRYLALRGEQERAAVLLERALGLAEALDLPETLANALNSKAILLMNLERLYESRILLEGALALALENDLHVAALRSYNNLAATLEHIGQWRVAIEYTDDALALARRIGDRGLEANFVAGPIGSLRLLGRWDEALARAAEADELEPNPFTRGLLADVVHVHCDRGELELARRRLDGLSSLRATNDPVLTAYLASAEAAIRRAEGKPAEALAAAEAELRAHAGAASEYEALRDALVATLEAAAALGDPEAVARQLALLDGLPPGQLTPLLRALGLRLRAHLAEGDADAEFAAAERLFGEQELPFHLAVTRLEHAEHLIAQGRGGEVEPLLDEAEETFERLRARPWLERLAAARAQRPAEVTA